MSLPAVALTALFFVTGVHAHSIIGERSKHPTCTAQWESAHSISDLRCCLKERHADLQHCLDDGIRVIAASGKTTQEILAELGETQQSDAAIESACHLITHAIGRMTFEIIGSLGKAFHACNHTCHAGCYHGVLETLFFTKEQRAAGIEHLSFPEVAGRVPTICTDPETRASKSILMQCHHGLGHAILFTLDYALLPALRACDLLPTDYARRTCHLGVFTENVIAAEREKRDLKRDDPLYPCNAIPETYRRECYRDQSKVMMHMGLSDQRIAELCSTLGENADVCFQGLGRDLSAAVRSGEAARAVHACEKLSETYARDCISGTVYALADHTGDSTLAFPFCAALEDPSNRSTCFRMGARYLADLYGKTRSDFRFACDALSETHLTSCVAAAKRETAGTIWKGLWALWELWRNR